MLLIARAHTALLMFWVNICASAVEHGHVAAPDSLRADELIDCICLIQVLQRCESPNSVADVLGRVQMQLLLSMDLQQLQETVLSAD